MLETREEVAAVGRIKSVPTILKVVARITGLRFTAISHVTDRRWLACAVYDEINFGVAAGDELPVETTICNEMRHYGHPVMFGNASDHPEFSQHPTPKLYNFESYVAVPIICAGGRLFGTLCALDRRVTTLDDPSIIETLELFAELIANSLDADEQLERATSMLAVAHEHAKLREQFIAVLGHDLRNPLQAIGMSAEALSMTLAGDLRKQSLANGIKRSVNRMSELILNILDFARGKLGDGIPVTLKASDHLGDELRQVIAEIRSAHPERELTSDIDLSATTVCDSPRVAQLLGNLLANAMTHGAVDHPVHVVLKSDPQQFEMSVRNGGPCIPVSILPNLFEPFTRAGPGASPDGLGLGLYIAKQIADAHHGTLEVSSTPSDGTCFMFRMPSQGFMPIATSEMAPLFRLIYRSTAAIPIDQDGLDRIVDRSQRNNAAVNVTGALVYSSGHFLQCLEGRRPAVESIWQRIFKDPRHRSIHIIEREFVPIRRFSRWAMLNCVSRKEQLSVLPLLDLIDNPSDAMRTLILGAPEDLKNSLESAHFE